MLQLLGTSEGKHWDIEATLGQGTVETFHATSLQQVQMQRCPGGASLQPSDIVEIPKTIPEARSLRDG
jgi:hypothetical protein